MHLRAFPGPRGKKSQPGESGTILRSVWERFFFPLQGHHHVTDGVLEQASLITSQTLPLDIIMAAREHLPNYTLHEMQYANTYDFTLVPQFFHKH